MSDYIDRAVAAARANHPGYKTTAELEATVDRFCDDRCYECGGPLEWDFTVHRHVCDRCLMPDDPDEYDPDRL